MFLPHHLQDRPQTTCRQHTVDFNRQVHTSTLKMKKNKAPAATLIIELENKWGETPAATPIIEREN